MMIIYHAANSLDAHMIKGLLEQFGIHAYIQGEYLQGGIGDLPVTGLVTVSVDNNNHREATKIVNEWQAGLIIEEETSISLSDGVLNANS
jgi:putative signal transducing protein